MKRTKDFEHFAKCAANLILKEEEMADVLLMNELNFTPPSWKIWKSKLIEWFAVNVYAITNNETNLVTSYKIIYDKKEKKWKVNYTD